MMRQNPVKEQESEETYNYDNSQNYYHNDNYTPANQYRGRRSQIDQNNDRAFRGSNPRGRSYRPQYHQQSFSNQRLQRRAYPGNRNQHSNSCRQFFNNYQQTLSRGRTHACNPHQMRANPHSRFNYRSNVNRHHQFYMHEQQTEQYGPPCSLCGRYNHSPKDCYKGERDINNIMEKMSINPHEQHQGTFYQ